MTRLILALTLAAAVTCVTAASSAVACPSTPKAGLWVLWGYYRPSYFDIPNPKYANPAHNPPHIYALQAHEFCVDCERDRIARALGDAWKLVCLPEHIRP